MDLKKAISDISFRCSLKLSQNPIRNNEIIILFNLKYRTDNTNLNTLSSEDGFELKVVAHCIK